MGDGSDRNGVSLPDPEDSSADAIPEESALLETVGPIVREAFNMAADSAGEELGGYVIDILNDNRRLRNGLFLVAFLGFGLGVGYAAYKYAR